MKNKKTKISIFAFITVILYAKLDIYGISHGYIKNYPITRETTPIFIYGALIGIMLYCIGKNISSEKKILKFLFTFGGAINFAFELVLLIISMLK